MARSVSPRRTSVLMAVDRSVPGVLQTWLDAPEGHPVVVVSGPSLRMTHGALRESNAPLFGRATEAFGVRPLPAGWIRHAFPALGPRDWVSLCALWAACPATGSWRAPTERIQTLRWTR